jgi:hypothetical protein
MGVNMNGVYLDLRVCNDVQRTIQVDNNLFNLSDDFTDLHTHSYKEIINGRGFKLDTIKKTMAWLKNIT